MVGGALNATGRAAASAAAAAAPVIASAALGTTKFVGNAALEGGIALGKLALNQARHRLREKTNPADTVYDRPAHLAAIDALQNTPSEAFQDVAPAYDMAADDKIGDFHDAVAEHVDAEEAQKTEKKTTKEEIASQNSQER